MPKVDIYKQLYALATKHFNVDPHNVIDDLIVNHLKIRPEKLTKQDLVKLLDWLEITSYLVIGNTKVAKSFMSKAKILAGEK